MVHENHEVSKARLILFGVPGAAGEPWTLNVFTVKLVYTVDLLIHKGVAVKGSERSYSVHRGEGVFC